MKTKRFVILAMLSAIAIVLNLFESLFLVGLPLGIKIGLANIIALITLVVFSVKEMIIINIMRVCIACLLKGTLFTITFWIASGGVILSSIALIVFYQKLHSSLMFTSIMSAIAHVIGQVIVVSFVYSQIHMFAIVPYLLLLSVPTGIFTAVIGKKAILYLENSVK